MLTQYASCDGFIDPFIFTKSQNNPRLLLSNSQIVFPLIDAGKEVHLNLKDVPYMDSSGISIIIESNQRAREKNTKVELKEVSQPVEKVLAMARKFL